MGSMITVLICSILTVNCTEATARDVIRLRQRALVCNPYPDIAELSISHELRPDERLVVKCQHR
jgi:hypothetical protein